MTFAEKMKELRKQKGKSQEQVSKEMGIAISSLRNYENGRLPDTFQLKQIKKYYDVTYEYLLEDKCENKTNTTINIGNELKLSEKSIDKIKNLQFSSFTCANGTVNNIDTPECAIAFNNFIENFENFHLLNWKYSDLQNCLELYKKVSSFLYLTYSDGLILYYIKNDKNKLNELLEYYNSLMPDITTLQIDTNINFLAYDNFQSDFKNFRKICLSLKRINTNYLNSTMYDKKSILVESIIEYLNSISTQLGFYKYQINEMITEYLSSLTVKYEVDNENLVNSCWDKEIQQHLKLYEKIFDNFKKDCKTHSEIIYTSEGFIEWILNKKITK